MSKDFFRFVFGEAEGYLCIATISRASGKDFKEDFYEYPSELDVAVEHVEREKMRRDVYYCPHLFRKPVRKKDQVIETPVAWSDVDDCPIDSLLVEPTLVVRSSNRKTQALWKFSQPVPPETGEAISKRIARKHEDEGMDQSGWDLTQLLRVPNTYNHKYTPPQDVKLTRVEAANIYTEQDFAIYPAVDTGNGELPDSLPENLPDKNAQEILDDYKSFLNPRAFDLFGKEPTHDWSKPLWELELILFEGGLSSEEVFLVVREAACNKYARDNRPEGYLWKEVQRAAKAAAENKAPVPTGLDESLTFELLSEAERAACEANPTIVEDYIEWAKTLGDAAWQYHQAGGFIVLSSLLSGAVRLPTSFGTILPNLWFMLLADTTLTRKTTSMDVAMELIYEIDNDALLATDGSIEGLLTAMSTRPGRPSIFLRDEFTGLMEMVTKRDYYSGMLEVLTKLYDGKYQKRILRRETIEVRDPILITFAGGIKSKMMELLDFEHVSSGFLPRFVFITAEADVTKLKPLGPPTMQTTEQRDELVERFRKIHDHYWAQASAKVVGNSIHMPKQWDAELTKDAWFRYNKIEVHMVERGMKMGRPDLMTPIMDRLCKSGLKVAMLIAASRRLEDKVVVEEEDIIRAFYYVEQWMPHSLYLIDNMGQTTIEKQLQQIVKIVNTRPGILRSDLMRRFRLSSRQTDAIVQTLEQRGEIVAKKEGRAEKYYPHKVK